MLEVCKEMLTSVFQAGPLSWQAFIFTTQNERQAEQTFPSHLNWPGRWQPCTSQSCWLLQEQIAIQHLRAPPSARWPGFNYGLISRKGVCVKYAFQSLRESRVGGRVALGFAHKMSPPYRQHIRGNTGRSKLKTDPEAAYGGFKSQALKTKSN